MNCQNGAAMAWFVISSTIAAVTPCAASAGSSLTCPARPNRLMRAAPGVAAGGWVVAVAGDVGLGGAAWLERAVAHLHVAGDQLDDQQAIGDVPDAVGVGARVGDLHASLVEVLHAALAAGSFGVGLAER